MANSKPYMTLVSNVATLCTSLVAIHFVVTLFYFLRTSFKRMLIRFKRGVNNRISDDCSWE